MKMTVFQSEKGDCVLLEGKKDGRVLADGGMSSTYTKHVSPFLGNLRKKNQELDAVYVSHIDEDHIDGILQMMEDEVAWRTFEYQIDPNGGNNKNAKKPTSIRPPKIGKVWHNAFHEQVGKNSVPIEEMIAATATILTGLDLTNRADDPLSEILKYQQNLATSVRQAINLSRRLGTKQLNIPLNPEAKHRLMMLRKRVGKPIQVGTDMKWTIISPMPVDLENLETEWNDWLRKNKKALLKIDSNAKKVQKNLGNGLSSSISQLGAIASTQAEMLGLDLQARAGITTATKTKEKKTKALGERAKVTTPNLASLMFIVEEKGAKGLRTILMTGDGHQTDIIKGLEATKHLKKNGSLHVDILKVQHHGAEFNIDEKFCKQVTADHYVFCGNGAHANPDLDVIKAIVNSRLNPADQSSHAKVNEPFKLWFNSNAQNPDAHDDDNAHMAKIEFLVAQLAAANPMRIKSFFLKDSKFEIDLT